MRNTEKPQRIILAVLDQIGKGISDDAAKIVRELVDHNEAGVALDILCSLDSVYTS
jgi:hypothetical protein